MNQDNYCKICLDKGYYPEWVEDDSPQGGHEGNEVYCDCPLGKFKKMAEEKKL